MNPGLSYVVLLLWDPVIRQLQEVGGGGRGLTQADKKQRKPRPGDFLFQSLQSLLSLFLELAHRHVSICNLSGHFGSLKGV